MHDPNLADLAASLPASVRIESPAEHVLLVWLARAEKRNALDDITVLGLAAVFDALPEGTRAVILAGEGEHFSAGLDLSELSSRDIPSGIEHSRLWHRIFETIQFGSVPVIAVLKGAVIGVGSSWRAPLTSAWLRNQRSTRCRKGSAAFSWAAAGRCV